MTALIKMTLLNGRPEGLRTLVDLTTLAEMTALFYMNEHIELAS
jgi:hypothetical protein